MSQSSNVLAVFLAHRSALVNYANQYVGDSGHAEDVVQEAYLRFNAVAAQRTLTEPVPYLYRIVRNLALDLRRGLNRDLKRHVPDGDDAIGQLPADRPSPEAEAGARHELRRLEAAMAELPDRMRLALELHRFGGCTFKQIGVHLGISTGLAHSLVVQGLEHCRERLCRK